MLSWLRRNWKTLLLVVAIGTAAATADHTTAHKVADAVASAVRSIDAEASEVNP